MEIMSLKAKIFFGGGGGRGTTPKKRQKNIFSLGVGTKKNPNYVATQTIKFLVIFSCRM